MLGSILVINAGSSSVKFQLFEPAPGDRLKRRLKGQIEGIATHPHLVARDQGGQLLVDESWPAGTVADVPGALDKVFAWLTRQLGGRRPAAVGHRVVHGGMDYAQPVLVDDEVLHRLERFVPLAPLHQPNNLAAIRALRHRLPQLPQVACFDTAFHRGHAETAERYAIPEALHREGVRRYGFHGLSYEYVASVLPRQAPELAAGRVVVAHLGSGCSLCALHGGRSVDTTMGFTALDGLPMGTRPGRIDPGVLLYLLTAKGWDAERLQHFLYHDCGLKGLSGLSNDMRDLLASDAPAARLAVDYFVYRTVQEVMALAGSLGGLDGIVFTAGIGENAPAIRERLCRALAWLGLQFDAAANAAGGPRLSRPGSKISAWVIPTDEERMIALHTHQLCAATASA
jgi:acetate kinase